MAMRRNVAREAVGRRARGTCLLPGLGGILAQPASLVAHSLIGERRSSMTRDRVISSAIGVPLMGLLVYFGGLRSWAGGALLVAAVGALAYLALNEFLSALKRKDYRAEKEVVVAATVFLVVAVWISEIQRATTDALVGVAIVAVAVATLAVKALRSEPDDAVANVGATLLAFVYVGCLFTYFLRLRLIDIPGDVGGVRVWSFLHECGALLFVFVAAWMTDTGAWFFGRMLGRHRMAPAVSPKKTIEGALAGVLTGTAFACLVAWWIHLPLVHGFILGVLLSVVGQVGDLSESLLKRDLGIKDAGDVIPGHGGVLDRFDSLLFAMPLAFYYLRLFVV